MIYAFDQKNYKAAKDAAQEVQGMADVRPVAKVTALQVMAECQMKEDKDYPAAMETLEQALALEGVAWAQPALTLALGDCYRFSGKFPQAIETFQKALELPSVNDGMKGIAYLNIGLTHQYNLHEDEEAKAAYKKAVELNPGLKKEVDEHLSRLP
jgi:tetratricopeptide (TPR) repeat protein